MSFFGKFKPGTTTSNNATPVKKDPNAPKPTLLDKHLADYTHPIRSNGSDKFFGFENYGSTCYANSVIQCLYYSEPFREHLLSFPPSAFTEEWTNRKSNSAQQENGSSTSNGALISPSHSTAAPAATTSTPYPNPTSPARKQGPTTSMNSPQKMEENKDSPEYKKKMAIQVGPVLDMTQDKSHDYGMDESLFTSLKDIFAAIVANQSRTGVVSPHKFLEILRKENEMFRSAMHQDAHEFLNLLLNSVVEKVQQFTKQQLNAASATNGTIQNGSLSQAVQKATPDSRWVHDIFEGVLTSETRCLTCETVSQRDEAFLDLSVDLSPHTSVTSCLRKFSQEEMLCERNKFHCDNCGGLQEAEKRMKIKRLPRVLALHLKRFKYTEDLQRLQKLFHKVVYPFHLRLFNTTDDAEDSDRLYELYAVVVHIGGGPYHGHYVSIVKTEDRGWLLFDDELVEPVDKDYVLNFFGGEPVPGVQDARQLACAYVLFYQQTTLEAVIREQEAERKTQATKTATSEPETAMKEAVQSPTPDALKLLGLTTPSHEHTEHHVLSPILSTPPSLPAGNTFMPDSAKSKKELKAEEKERKAVSKAEEKAALQRQKETSEKRVEVPRRQEDELKLARDASKSNLVDDPKRRGDESTHQEKSAFSRFMRPGSIHLKGRPKLSATAGQEEPVEGPTAPPTALPHGALIDEGKPGSSSTSTSQTTSSSTPTPTVDDLVKAHKEKKKNRFSLGRKRSMQMF